MRNSIQMGARAEAPTTNVSRIVERWGGPVPLMIVTATGPRFGQGPRPAGVPRAAGLTPPSPFTTPSHVALVQPVDRADLHSSTIRFTWATTDGDHPKAYELRVCNDEGLKTSCVPSVLVDPDTRQAFVRLPPGDYFWSVRAQNLDGSWNEFVARNRLHIQDAVMPTGPGDALRGKDFLSRLGFACASWAPLDHAAKARLLDPVVPGVRVGDPMEGGHEDQNVEQAIVDVDAFCAMSTPPVPPTSTPPMSNPPVLAPPQVVFVHVTPPWVKYGAAVGAGALLVWLFTNWKK